MPCDASHRFMTQPCVRGRLENARAAAGEVACQGRNLRLNFGDSVDDQRHIPAKARSHFHMGMELAGSVAAPWAEGG